MDAASVRSRLAAEGIDVTVHRDGTLVAWVLKPSEQTWKYALAERVRALPGAVVVAPPRESPSIASPYLSRTEVRFVLGSVGMVGRVAAGAA